MPSIPRSSCSQYDNIQSSHIDCQNDDDDLEHVPLIDVPLIDVPNTSIKDEINDLTLKIKEVVDELSSMVDKSTNIYLVRAETLNLLMKDRQRLYKQLDEIKDAQRGPQGQKHPESSSCWTKATNLIARHKCLFAVLSFVGVWFSSFFTGFWSTLCADLVKTTSLWKLWFS